MLEYSFGHEQEITREFQKIAYDEHWKYYWGSGVPQVSPYEVSKDSNVISMVSIGTDGKILGILEYCIDDKIRSVSNLWVCSFSKETNIVFSRDFHKFWTDIFKVHKLNKVNWYVVIGNPIEQSYDKLVKRYGGRIVGTFDDDVMTYDGQLLPRKYYELTRKTFEKTIDS